MAYTRSYQDAGRNMFWCYLTGAYTQNNPLAMGSDPPSGFGDVLLHAVTGVVQNIAAVPANIANAAARQETPGIGFVLGDPAGAFSAFLGVHRMYSYDWIAAFASGPSAVGCELVQLMRPLLWRSQYGLYGLFPELDTAASPTAQATVWALVERIRER